MSWGSVNTLGTSFHAIIWPTHHNPVELCVDASTSPHPLTLLMFNSLVRQTEIATTSRPTSRHSQYRETPLPIYLGITRKRALVDTLFDRVLDISTELGEKIYHHYEVEKAVCPPQLRVACLQLPQWTILTTIRVQLVHTSCSMELVSPSSSI
jgi:hypothetical protein